MAGTPIMRDELELIKREFEALTEREPECEVFDTATRRRVANMMVRAIAVSESTRRRQTSGR